MRKQEDPFDEFIRSRLDDFEVAPPPESRNMLIGRFSGEARPGRSSQQLMLRIAAGLLLLGGVLLGVLLLWPREEPGKMANTPSIHDPVPVVSQEKEDVPAELKKEEELTAAPQSPPELNTRNETTPGMVQKPAETAEVNTQKESLQSVSSGEASSTRQTGPGIDPLPSESTPIFTGFQNENAATLDSVRKLTQDELTEIIHSYKSHPPKPWNFSLGAYYTPEVIFSTLDGEKFANNTGVEGALRFGRYSVRTGIGVSVTSGSNEILVKTNPYLGTYEILDSVIFVWDEQHINLVPVYYTTGKEIYDTALHYNYYQLEKRYTYLQVPLVLGYDFWSNDKISVGLRGGAVMSVLVKTKNLTSDYNPGMDRVVTVNYITPDRIALNWQALAGINTAFRLSKRFSLELEPEVRYYFNSVYESTEITRKPWSLGLRAAVQFSFVN